MNTWIWVHPAIGGAILLNMSNVVYLFGSKDGTTMLVLTNGKELVVEESEEYIIKGLNHEL